MLDQNAVLDANDVRRDPVNRKAKIRESPVHDHEISFGQYCAWLIFECWRKAFDEVEEAVTSGRDVSAVLDVVGRPELPSSSVVTPVEQHVERFQDKRLVLRFDTLTHHFHVCHLSYLLFVHSNSG